MTDPWQPIRPGENLPWSEVEDSIPPGFQPHPTTPYPAGGGPTAQLPGNPPAEGHQYEAYPYEEPPGHYPPQPPDRPDAQQYSPQPDAVQPYTGQPYQGQSYSGQSYPGQPYAAQPYSGRPYQGQPYSGQPYPGQPYAGQRYPGQRYPGQQGYVGQTGYPTSGGYPPDPGAPFGRNALGEPWSDKQKTAAGLLQIFLGMFGVGRFYLNQPGIAVAQIAATWLTCGLGYIWPFIDGIMILSGSVRDEYGRPLRD